MTTFEQLADRLALQDLITAYSYAIDFHRFDDLDDLFTPDATLDFTATGGIVGPLPEVKQWLASVLPNFSGHQHLVGTTKVQLTGDAATASSICHNPMYIGEQVIFVGLWYHDTFARTAGGWRFTARVQQKGYLHGLPQR
ncbi:MAG: nuclear transport factor 2 family protein [Jatrophihabitans sp.]|uniref:nuclear transport factor 2 family protein n=1 Tax=Jatrophihabitans sp. TaxID=1932789 RepID=UPI003F81B7CA